MAGLGETLRQARLERGVSLEEAERATKILKGYLAALETEDFSHLPAPTYVKGFLQRYAHYLGLSTSAILDLYRENRNFVEMKPIPHLPKPPQRLGSWLVIGTVILIMASGGFYLYRQNQAIPPPPEAVAFEPPAVTPLVLPTATPTPMPTASPTLTPRPAATPTRTPEPTPEPTPNTVGVPSAIFLGYIDAEKALTKEGFRVVKEEQWNQEVATGVVFAQNPLPGQRVPPGAKVTLTVSKGRQRAIVPNVKNMPEREAKQAILNAGLRYDPFINYQGRAYGDDPKKLEWACVGCVLSITPEPGTEVEFGTEVKIAVRVD